MAALLTLLPVVTAVPGCGSTEAEDCAACDVGATCLDSVCIRTPTVEASLGGEGRDADGESVALDLGISPNTQCWVTPDAAPAAPATVSVRGRIDELAVGPPKAGMCVTAYRQQELVRHWTTESRCPGVADVAERVACFRANPCACDALTDEAARAACSADVGPALAHAPSSSRDGDYALEGLPTNAPLVFRLSGHEGLWKETFMWGIEIRTDRLEVADDGSPYARFDPIGVSEGDWGVIQTLLGLSSPVPPDRGVVAGELRDCGDADRGPEPIIGATFHLEPAGIVSGFHGGDPNNLTEFSPDIGETRNLGIFGSVGVPEGPNRFVAAVKVGEAVKKVADYDLYVPPSAGVILYVKGRVMGRAAEGS